MRLKATGHFKLGWFLRFIAPSGMLACWLIILTASPSISSNTLAEAPTRFGTVTIVEHCDESGSCSKASATLGSKTIDLVINSANKIDVNILAIFPTSDGDLVILDIPAGRALPYCCLAALLVRNATDLEVISNAAFYSADFTPFRVESGDGSLIFDLGFENKKHKTAIYDHGKLTVTFASSEQKATLSKSDCAYVLEAVKDCISVKECSTKEAVSDSLPLSVQRNLAALENKPGFHTEEFSGQCQRICTTGKYDLREVRKRLCGY
jgi:hypothetical protein